MDNIQQMQQLAVLSRSLVTEKLVRDSNRQQIVNSGILEEVGITLDSSQCVLLMVDILDYTPGKFDIYFLRKTDRDTVMHSVIEQMFVSSFEHSFNAYSFLSDGQSYILLNLQTPKSAPTQEWLSRFMNSLVESCADCVRRARENYGMEIKVYVGEFLSSLDELGGCKELLDKMLANDYIGEDTGGVFTTDELNTLLLTANEVNDRLYALYRRILELSQKHRFEEAGQSTIEMLRLESLYYGISAGTRSRLTSLVTVLYAVIGIPYYQGENSPLSIHEVTANIDSCLSNGELVDYMQQLFQDFEKYFLGESKSKQRRVEDIVDYINENYSNHMLCAAMICDHFDINHTYLSRLFKEARSEKLIDFIHKTRIRHAKAYLASTGETIDTIARRVGYHNTLTFTRAFKRYEGVTPGAFRSTQKP